MFATSQDVMDIKRPPTTEALADHQQHFTRENKQIGAKISQNVQQILPIQKDIIISNEYKTISQSISNNPDNPDKSHVDPASLVSLSVSSESPNQNNRNKPNNPNNPDTAIDNTSSDSNSTAKISNNMNTSTSISNDSNGSNSTTKKLKMSNLSSLERMRLRTLKRQAARARAQVQDNN